MSVALPLFEPGLYHDLGKDNSSYFSIFRKFENGKTKTEPFDTRSMPEVVRACVGLPDTYITQGDFLRPQRTVAALKSLGLFWADLGDDGELAKLGESEAVKAILAAVKEADIPLPSFIVASGRGFHAKWLFSSRVSWSDLTRWQALERCVVGLLRKSLYADPAATSPNQVLRLVDTLNTRTNTITKIVWRSTDERGEIVRYNFEEMFRSVVPPGAYSVRNDDNEKIIASARKAGLYVETHKTWEANLWLTRLVDERALFSRRGWTPENGGVPKGYRDLALFVGATALTWFAQPGTWWNETQSLAAEFAPSLRETEWRSYVSCVWKRMQYAYERRSTGGVEDPRYGRYRFKNARLAQLFDVSRDEMPLMRSFIDDNTRRERAREYDRQYDEKRRRGRGEVERGLYLARENEKTLALAREAKALIDAGMSLRGAAENLDASLGAIQNALRVAARDSLL